MTDEASDNERNVALESLISTLTEMRDAWGTLALMLQDYGLDLDVQNQVLARRVIEDVLERSRKEG